MLGKLKLWSLSSLALMLITIAHTGIGPRCGTLVYEPDIPESLKVDL